MALTVFGGVVAVSELVGREPRVGFTVALPVSTRLLLEEVARRNERSVGAEVRRAVDAHLAGVKVAA